MILLVRAATVLVLLLLAAAVSAAAPSAQPDVRTLKPADLPAILDPRPNVPKWTFELGDSYIYPTPAHDPAFTLREWLGESPNGRQRALAAKLQKDGFVIGRHRRWGAGTKVQQAGYVQHLGADAVFFAFLFRDAAGAHAAFRVLVSTLGEGKSLAVKSLGEEAVGRSANDGALYLWRRTNLVILAQWVCDSDCGFPAAPPARTYAFEIDARAKAKS